MNFIFFQARQIIPVIEVVNGSDNETKDETSSIKVESDPEDENYVGHQDYEDAQDSPDDSEYFSKIKVEEIPCTVKVFKVETSDDTIPDNNEFHVNGNNEEKDDKDDQEYVPLPVTRKSKVNRRKRKMKEEEEESDVVCHKSQQRIKEMKKSTVEIQCYLCSEMMPESQILDHGKRTHHRDYRTTRLNVAYGETRPFKCYVCNASLKVELGKGPHMCVNLLPPGVGNSEKQYNCEKCKKVMNTCSTYLSHITSDHDTKKRFKCTLCELRFTGGMQLFDHVRSKHKEVIPKSTALKASKAFKCLQCEYSTITQTVLESHIERTHNNKKEITCEICGTSVSKKLLKRHMAKEHGPPGKRTTGFFPCEICNQMYDTEHGLNTHKTLKHESHNQTERRTCEFCGTVAVSVTLLLLHIKKEHVLPEQVSKMECMCEKCDTEFTNSVDLNNHLKGCLDELPLKDFKCDMCSLNNWHSVIALRRHIGEEHQKDRLVCDICGQILKTHMKLHKQRAHGIGGPPATCDQCGKGLSSKSRLKMHIKAIHENFRAFQCTDCGQKFCDDPTLQRHRQSKHIREVKYKCPHCSYFTYRSGVISKHILEVHDRIKRHNCNSCDAGYFYKRDLVKHLEKYPTHVGNFHDSKLTTGRKKNN
jgi:transcription elongation factor Elf1